MTPVERLLDYFDRISEAPDAITRLRWFVLALAVQGRLVRQDPAEQPADNGLAAARASIATRAERTSRIRWEPSLGIDESTRHRVPRGWTLARINDTGLYVNGLAFKPADWRAEGVPIVRIQNLTDPSKSFNYATGTFPDEVMVRNGDVLVSWSATLDAFVWNRGSAVLNQHIFRVLLATELVYSDFLVLLLRSAMRAIAESEHAHGVAMLHVNRRPFLAHIVLVPPLAEQHRIVARVNELMALCDRIEAVQKERDRRREKLAAVSLAGLGAATESSFHEQRQFYLTGLPRLTRTTNHVQSLRRSIVDLAVRGRLVQQAKKDPIEMGHSADGTYEQRPVGWRTLPLSDLLSEDTRNGYSRKPDDVASGTPILRISAGTVRKDGLVAEEEHKFITGISPAERVQYGLLAGDLLACRFNGNRSFVGRLTLFQNYLGIDPIYPDKLIRVRLSPGLADPAFIRLAAESDIVRLLIEEVCATTVGNWGISATNLKKVLFPVPPLEEQGRIVAKVTELMTACDQLEAQIDAGRTARAALLEATLREVLEDAAVATPA